MTILYSSFLNNLQGFVGIAIMVLACMLGIAIFYMPYAQEFILKKAPWLGPPSHKPNTSPHTKSFLSRFLPSKKPTKEVVHLDEVVLGVLNTHFGESEDIVKEKLRTLKDTHRISVVGIFTPPPNQQTKKDVESPVRMYQTNINGTACRYYKFSTQWSIAPKSTSLFGT